MRNELSDCQLFFCPECDTTTPHCPFDKCLTCQALPLDETKTSEILLQAAAVGVVPPRTRGKSLIKVAALVGDFQFPRPNGAVRGVTEFPILALATTIVEFRMRREAITATKHQIEQWLREILVASELDGSYEAVSGRTISSLCGQKILIKINTGQYRLADA